MELIRENRRKKIRYPGYVHPGECSASTHTSTFARSFPEGSKDYHNRSDEKDPSHLHDRCRLSHRLAYRVSCGTYLADCLKSIADQDTLLLFPEARQQKTQGGKEEYSDGTEKVDGGNRNSDLLLIGLYHCLRSSYCRAPADPVSHTEKERSLHFEAERSSQSEGDQDRERDTEEHDDECFQAEFGEYPVVKGESDQGDRPGKDFLLAVGDSGFRRCRERHRIAYDDSDQDSQGHRTKRYHLSEDEPCQCNQGG